MFVANDDLSPKPRSNILGFAAFLRRKLENLPTLIHAQQEAILCFQAHDHIRARLCRTHFGYRGFQRFSMAPPDRAGIFHTEDVERGNQETPSNLRRGG